MATLHPVIPLVILAALVPQVIAQRHHLELYYQRMAEHSRAAREMDVAVRTVTDPIPAREVRAFGLGDFFLGRYRERFDRATREMRVVRLRSLRSSLLMTLPLAAALAGSLWYVADRAAAGTLTPGDVVLFLTATIQLGLNAPAVSDIGHYFSRSLPALRLLDQYQRRVVPGIVIAPAGSARPVPDRFTDGLALDDVHFAYPDADEPVLRGLMGELPAGKVTALVGANGAGKSTIVKLLTRMYDLTGGTIRLDGAILAEWDLGGYRRRTSATFQDFARFAFNLRTNIAVGAWPDQVDDADLDQAAAWSGADAVVADLPDGYDTGLTRYFAGGVELSGGQWQRVALARSALRDAALVILDEPNAALDAEAEARQIDRLHERAAGRTCLLISHRLSTVRRADHILVLDGGRITERGTHDELIAAGGEYARLFAMQADRFR